MGRRICLFSQFNSHNLSRLTVTAAASRDNGCGSFFARILNHGEEE
jgi:hypothetical protein